MSTRLSVLITLAALVMSLAGPSTVTAVAAKSPAGAAVTAPASADTTSVFGVTLSLPADVAAFDGRVLVQRGAAEVVGLAPLGGGTALRPEAADDGFAIGAYDLEAADGRTKVDIAVAAAKAGRLQVRVVIDSAATKDGTRVELDDSKLLATVSVNGGKAVLKAPDLKGHAKPTRGAKKVRDLFRDGKIDQRDVDGARAEWIQARTAGATCAPSDSGDVNDDGCTDVVDIQGLVANDGAKRTAVGGFELASTGRATTSAATAAAPLRTFVVNSPLDTPDATPGNGICATSTGVCTLRAAITEADWMSGEDLINFDLPGTAPVRIQLTSRLPLITTRNGATIIDGYSQPGSSPNTATFGSNAVPGVEIRGNGTAAREVALFITGSGHTVRGLLFGNLWRGIFLDGVNARENRIVGNWLGYTTTQASAGGQYGILFNNGANRNIIGTPALADRNVIGNWSAGIDVYGPGSDANVMQNNLFCIRPSGGNANCSSAIDHNFGPKSNVFGGLGTNERNVIGGTSLQCIELSHGYNPSGPPGTDFSLTYQINNNRIVGNWAGFRADGSYNSLYRCGLNPSSSDNGQGINVYDGTNDNIVEGNYVGSAIDGIQTMAPTAQRNIIRNNVIGESPLGEAAPLSRWGVIVRWGSTFSTVEGNTIKNAAAGGIGLLDRNNRGDPQAPAYNIKLSKNIVSGTNGPAIDLFGVAGPDPNDAGDGDTGANTVLNTPVISSATTSAVRGTGAVGATVEVYRASRAAGLHGLPAEYLGSATVASNGQWVVATSLSLGQTVTAIQILPDSNTSEFAVNVAVTASTPTAPTFTSGNTTTFVAGTAGSFTVTTAGTPAAEITRTGSLPSGVTFVDNGNGTGTLSGTPGAGTAGAYSLTFTAANGVSPNATQSFTLQVNAAPAFTSAAQATFTVGANGSFQVTTSGRPAATVSVTGALPAGVTFTPGANGTATLSGTPAVGTDGSYPLTFTAQNGVAPNASQSFTLTVDPAPAGGPIATDTFTRTVSRGWGSANTGGAWTVGGSPGDFSVNGSTGRITLSAGATRMAHMLSVSAADTDILVTVATDKRPTGGNVFYYVLGRRTATNTEYRAKVRIAANGTVWVQPSKAVSNTLTVLGPELQVPGLVADAGQPLAVRVQYLGTSPTLIRMRVWDPATTEPTVWHASQSDSQAQLQTAGAIGLRAYLASNVTVAPVTVSWDNLTVTP